MIDQNGNPVTIYPCCEHCEHDDERDPHRHPCIEGCNDDA